jgi:MFS transporter, DHA2 family, multidrug resistance protein
VGSATAKYENGKNILVHNPWIIAIAVMFPTALEILDSTVANVALPYISGGLASSINESTWVLTSYIISNAIMLPITYWFSDKLGRKNFLLISVVVFTFSSLMCGFSTSLEELIFFRIIQGFGGGGLTPLAQSILLETFPKEKHGQAMGFYGFGLLFAPVIGPFIGGWLSDNYTWNWIFFINIPLGIIGFFMIKYIIPEKFNNNKKKSIKIDCIGLSLLFLFIAPFQAALDKGQENDWFSSNFIIFLSIIAVVSFVALIIWLLKAKDPLINLKIFKNWNFSIAIILIFVRSFGFYAFNVVNPLFLENLMGYTATVAGEISIFSGIAIMISMPIIGILTSKYNNKFLIFAGLLLCYFAVINLMGFTLHINFGRFALFRAIFGIGSAFMLIPLNTVAFSTVSKENMTQSTGMLSLARSIGSSIGISSVTTLIARRSQIHQNILVNHTNILNRHFTNYVHSIQTHLHTTTKAAYQVVYNIVTRQATFQAYIDVFQVILIFLLIIAPLIPLLRTGRKSLKIGHSH